MVARVGVYYGADFNGCSGATLVLIGGRDIRREGRVGKGGATPWHIFYADDGMVASTDPDWLQGEFDTLTGIFNRVLLWENVRKMIGMIFHP